MKLLLIDHEPRGCGLALALRALQAGHEVRYAADRLAPPSLGSGFRGLSKVSSWLPSAKWADLVVATGNDEYLAKFGFLKTQGIKVFAPSAAVARLELDPAAGYRLMFEARLMTPAGKSFDYPVEAETHIRQEPTPYFASGPGWHVDGQSPAALVHALSKRPAGAVLLQDRPAGRWFTVSRWIGAQGFIGHASESATSAAGVLHGYSDTSRAFTEVLAPLEQALVKLGALGLVSAHCIQDASGAIWPMRLSVRMEWPLCHAMFASHEGDPIEWMRAACEGRDELKVSTDTVLAVTCDAQEGTPLYGPGPNSRRFVSLQEARMEEVPVQVGRRIVEKQAWVSAGNQPFVVTGAGRSVKQAQERAYKVIDSMDVSGLDYARGLGTELESRLQGLPSELRKVG